MNDKELAACLAAGAVLGISAGYLFTLIMEFAK